MSSSHHTQPSLAYYQTSPVRGQLEPYEAKSRAGWRYLQCTDTPNELKVLLPPKTALLYSQLLQYEIAELERGRGADWDRILHIRHLKDRMIRKCQRLSRMVHTPGAVPAFRVVHAPPDFRLKEMERWLRDQEPRSKKTKEVRRQPSAETVNTHSQSSHPAYTHAQSSSRSPRTSRIPTSMTPTQRISSNRAPGVVRRHGSGSSRSSNYVDSHASTDSLRQKSSAHAQTLPPRNPYLSPVAEERTESPPPTFPNPYGDTPQRAAEESTIDSAAAVRADAVSPDPLPHLYRPPSMHAPLAEIAAAMMAGLPEPISEPVPELAPLPLGTEMPEPTVESFLPAEPAPHGMPHPGVLLESIESILDPDQPVLEQSRPSLVRRRSSLRQGGGRTSVNGTPKVVSWAMDRDWADHLTKFDHDFVFFLLHCRVYFFFRDLTSVSGSELEEARKKFQEEVSGVQNLRLTITSALERLRLESDTLQREEYALRENEERMIASFERLKEKEARYKERGDLQSSYYMFLPSLMVFLHSSSCCR
ncbi:hypothetical protein B0F90DRAFT_1681279 [Multifurca ochricompacta]|uniref:Uncharacterized protein n=1 Tax=Multifurca ochricompacta TaxID=376703 RepID=A0AAD4MGX2_9AGAM|nr:hypothetical protein B0F90DRAFT_1681279 [Multifurca ochricompacta]